MSCQSNVKTTAYNTPLYTLKKKNYFSDKITLKHTLYYLLVFRKFFFFLFFLTATHKWKVKCDIRGKKCDQVTEQCLEIDISAGSPILFSIFSFPVARRDKILPIVNFLGFQLLGGNK